MSKKKLRRDRALMEIPRLRANRRSGIMLTALGGILAVVVIMGIPVLQGYGILPYNNMVISVVTFATAVCACGVLGLGEFLHHLEVLVVFHAPPEVVLAHVGGEDDGLVGQQAHGGKDLRLLLGALHAAGGFPFLQRLVDPL